MCENKYDDDLRLLFVYTQICLFQVKEKLIIIGQYSLSKAKYLQVIDQNRY